MSNPGETVEEHKGSLKYKEEQKSEALANPYRVNLNNIVAVAE